MNKKAKKKPFLVVVINLDGSLGKIFQRKTFDGAIKKAAEEAWDLEQASDRAEILNHFKHGGNTEYNTGDNGRVVLAQTEED